MTTYNFEVRGKPTPQGSKTAVKLKSGAAIVIDAGSTTSREAHKDWRRAVADAARELATQQSVCLTTPCEVHIHFRFEPTKVHAKLMDRNNWTGMAKATQPDLDKLIRSVLDGLVAGGLIRDDALVGRIIASKREVLGWIGAVITIFPDYT